MTFDEFIAGVSRRINRRRTELALRRVAATPPLRMKPEGPVVLSMLCHRDLHMYLASFKSFYRALGGGRAVIVNDGSLTAEDRALLEHHIPLLAFVDIASVERGPCPAGGTWERLLSVVDASQGDYVIQLDADTLTVGPVTEIVEAYRANRAFTLAGEATSKQATAREASNRSQHPHVQAAAEMALGDLPDADKVKYVRGCSGFTGFPKGGATRQQLYAFSTFMTEKLGERWTEWGTEQFSSNFLLGNCDDLLILPWDKYCSYTGAPSEGVAFYHFIGTYRYTGGLYSRLARQVIRALA
jgi:hypothetical protein